MDRLTPAPPPWPYTDGPTSRLAWWPTTTEDVEQRLLQLKKTAAVKQKERLREYRGMLTDYRQRLGLRAGWIRGTLATLRSKEKGNRGAMASTPRLPALTNDHVFCLPLISEVNM